MKVVSFVNMKGGVGKTTLAVNIADFLARRNSKRILLIDVDPQFNATQCLLPGDEYVKYLSDGGSTVVDIFNYQKREVSLVEERTIREEKKYENITPYVTKRGFALLPGRLDLFRFEMAPGQGTEHRLKNYLKHIEEKDEYDICIIDCPPTPSVWMTSALLSSDFYLIPSKPDPISMTGLELLEGIIRERADNYGCDCKCLGLVLTMVETNTRVYKEAKEHFSINKAWKDYLYEPVFLKRTEVARGQTSGMFVLDIDDSELKKEFSGIVQELLRRLGD